MNENHIRHLVSTFRYIDKLMAGAEQILVDAASPSPFQEYTPDSTPVQRKVIHDYCVGLREAMDRIMIEHDIPKPNPVCGALWGARSRFTFISIAAAEVAPNHMRGYGELTDDDFKVLEGMVVELSSVADRLQAFLDEGESADLQARLSRLEKTADQVRLLSELDRIITVHGLVEFRGAIRRLVDKLENSSF